MSVSSTHAATPALAWSSWNYFTTAVNETIILEIADKLVSTGLADLGFKYVNIDAGVYIGERNQTTMRLVENRKKFPRGMRYIADQLHAKGLRFGLYTDLSDHTCGTGPGSLGHYEADAKQFAHDWQIDYLKVDFCGARNGTQGYKPFNQSCSSGALAAGYDLLRANMTAAQALAWCGANATCAGFTTQTPKAAACGGGDETVLDVYFKSQEAKPHGDARWSYWLKPGAGRVDYQPQPQYDHWHALGRALNQTGRPIWYSICPHTAIDKTSGNPQWAGTLAYSPPFEWNRTARHQLANSILVEYANTWDSWDCGDDGEKCNGQKGGIITNIDSMVQLTRLFDSGPGSWNDADMLQLCTYGKGRVPGEGMTLSEYRAHYSVWSVLASPLILSADLRAIEKEHPECLELMLNADIVAVNQDEGGHPPRLIRQTLKPGTPTIGRHRLPMS